MDNLHVSILYGEFPMIEISKFLRDGLLGPVDVGMLWNDLLDLLGLPDAYESMEQLKQDVARTKSFSFDRFWVNYGSIEMHFQGEELDSFTVRTQSGNDRIWPYPQSLDVGWLDKLLTLDKVEILGLAKRSQLDFEEQRVPGVALGIWIPVSHVLITFDDILGESVSYVARYSDTLTYPKLLGR